MTIRIEPSRRSGQACHRAAPAQSARVTRTVGDVVNAVAATIGLAAVLVGLPLLLVVTTGPPWPAHPPSISGIGAALTRPDDGRLLVGALRVLAWVGWAAFGLSVLVEAAAQLRGRPTPHLHGLLGVQQLTARLVTAAALVAPAVPVSLAWAPSPIAVAAPAVALAGEGQHIASALPQTPASPDKAATADPADALAPAAHPARAGQPHMLYVVEPLHDGHRDSLWSIAARHLGDPLRWREIAALNMGRPQPDGRSLSDPHWIYPGWRLLMPADATGVDVEPPVDAAPPGGASSSKVPVSEAPAAPAQRVPERAVGPIAPDVAAQQAQKPPVVAAPTPRPLPASASPDPQPRQAGREADAPSQVAVRFELACAGLLAAGVLALLSRLRVIQRRHRPTGRRLRRPAPALAQAEVALRVLAEPDDVDFLDRALRCLSVLLRPPDDADVAPDEATAYPLSHVVSARLNARSLKLLLTEPARPAPSPYVASADGRTWSLSRTAPLPTIAFDDGAAVALFPALLPVGHDAKDLVLLDLEALGSTALVGDTEAAGQLLHRYAAELAVARWSRWSHVTLVGFGAALCELDPDRITYADTLDEAMLRAVEAHAEHCRSGADREVDQVGDQVLARRLDAAEEPCGPRLLLLTAPPPPAVGERLIDVAHGRHRTGVAILCAGALPGAAHVLAVGDDMRLDVPSLGITVNAHGMTNGTADVLADLVAAGRAREATTAEVVECAEDAPPATTAAAEVVTEVPGPTRFLHLAARDVATESLTPAIVANDDRVAPPPHAGDTLDRDVDAYLDAASPGYARVGILGRVEVRALRPTPAERGPLLTELITYLALHPRGVEPADLDLALWPERAIRQSTRHEALTRARNWLGNDAEGQPLIPPGHAGDLRLGPGVLLDWDLFQRLVRRGSAAGAAGAEDLARALQLVRGNPFQNTPPHRYAWVAEMYLEQDVPAAVVDAAHELARLRMAAGDPAAARDAARIAQLVDRYDERPWRDLLEAEHAMGNVGAVRALADELLRLLDVEVYDDLTDETAKLLRQVLPHRRPGTA